jgi:phosphatidylserine/phosphatidylglycerophosphate/cardiolipin synthase-like enzyme
MPEVLCNSAKISARIRKLFEAPSSSDRRVVLVAYIGRNYAQFLPNVRGIEIVCSPTAGATSGFAVSELMASGAVMKFSDQLHMKVYWSAERGCLITSANLSANALQRGKLKEVGVFLNSKDVRYRRIAKGGAALSSDR